MDYNYPYSGDSYGNSTKNFSSWERPIRSRSTRNRSPRRVNFSDEYEYADTTPLLRSQNFSETPTTRQLRRVNFKQARATVQQKAPIYWDLVLTRIRNLSDHIIGNLCIAIPLDIALILLLSYIFTDGNLRFLIWNAPVITSMLMTLMACFVAQMNILESQYSRWLVVGNAVAAMVVGVLVAQVTGPPLTKLMNLGWFEAIPEWVVDRFADAIEQGKHVAKGRGH